MGMAEDAKTRAIEARNRLGVSANESVNVLNILRSILNVSIIGRPLASNVSGLFVQNNDVRIILINTNRSRGHQHFTAAHELCHLLYHEALTGQICEIGLHNPKSPIEKEADLFACHFLAPDQAIDYLLNKRQKPSRPVSLADCVFLEQYFGISHQAMLIRLQQMGKISNHQAEQWKDGITRVARELGYDTSLYKTTADYWVMSDYAEKAREALDRDLISRGKYEELLLEAGLEDVLFGGETEDD